MSGTALVSWSSDLLAYHLGDSHPLHPVRLELTADLAGRLGVLDRSGVRVAPAEPADDDLLRLVHSPELLHAVRCAPADLLGRAGLRYGIGTPDNPVFESMHEAAAHVVGHTVAAARAVWEGSALHAVSFAGGLHHAMRDRVSGFCVYNDPAVAIAWLLRAGAERVAYVDVDVHHGDGVEAAFADDPRVLTVSLHESGRFLFPGTGQPEDTGTGGAAGTVANVALPPGTGDDAWLRAFDAVVPPLVRAFRPTVLVTQSGADTHAEDPLAHLELSVDGQAAAASRLHALAHQAAGGRWLATGGGGYSLVSVVPRAWTHLLAEVTGAPLDPRTPTPRAWRELAARRRPSRSSPPVSLTDGRTPEPVPWEGGPGAEGDPVDRAVLATREAVFPLVGLDPWAADG